MTQLFIIELSLCLYLGAFFTPERSYRFSFELKSDLPSTFSSECGEIKYKMKFVVDKRWFNEKQKIPLYIVRTVNLNFIAETLQPFELQLTKNYGLITSSGPISLHVSIPKRGFVLGDNIPIKVNIYMYFICGFEKSAAVAIASIIDALRSCFH